jgi:hypothetical protein
MAIVSSGESSTDHPESELAGILDHALRRADGLGLDLVAVRIAQAIDHLNGSGAVTEADEQG